MVTMSQLIVRKSKIQGSVDIPPSKSQTLRAILFATLAKGKSTIRHYLQSPDTLSMIKACEQLGAHITLTPDHLDVIGVDGQITGADNVIDAGNSGIVLRFISGIASLGNSEVTITGDESICSQRPMQPMLDALNQLNVKATSNKGNGFAPITVNGPITPGKATLNGQDSQPVTALIIASAFSEGPTELQIQNPGEKPWVALTLDWLDRLGIPYENDQYAKYIIPGKSHIEAFDYTVPADLSSNARINHRQK